MPKNLKNIITAKFKRTFIDGLQHTWLFGDAPEAIKGHLIQALGNVTAQNIVVCSFFAENDWFVVTTEDITIEKNGARQVIGFIDISKVDCDFKQLAANKNKAFDVIELHTSNSIVPLEVEKKTWGPWTEVLKLFLNKK